MNSPITLQLALTPLRQHQALLDGGVQVPGVELVPVPVARYLDIFRRMGRDQEFDICEFSVMSYLTAREHGLPFSAIPVFPRHRFGHGDFLVHRDAGISAPAELVGRRIGTRSWTVTPGVWDRGILSDEFGVRSSSCTWVLGDDEHVAPGDDLLPPNVEPPSRDGRALFERLREGELDAGIAGVKRDGQTDERVVRLFDDPAGLDRDQYARTGNLPVFTLITVHDRVLVDRPWLPQALFEAFEAARAGGIDLEPSVAAVDPDDPAPTGLAANRDSLLTMLRLGREQEILLTDPEPEELFLPVG